MSGAYYNEIDPFAAEWLRNLIAAGHIAPGVVDERSIRDVAPDDLKGFTQCHFFAGVGVWSKALRDAGWPDDRPVWTGSCPCQPFSAAGQQKGFDDERHLWPVWFNLVRQCAPAIVLGEQVASALAWLDLVSADMEGAGYAFGAADLCAAGFSGAHIRQRLYFAAVGDAGRAGSQGRGRVPERADQRAAGPGGVAGGLAIADDDRREARRLPIRSGRQLESAAEQSGGGKVRTLADAELYKRRQIGADAGGSGSRGGAQGLDERSGDGGHERDGLADTNGEAGSGRRVCGPGEGAGAGDGAAFERSEGLCQDRPADAPMLGRHAVDWLLCRDGKWRPVEPGTFPLADAAPQRVGRLRAYGNGLDLETATEFCGAVKAALVELAA